MITCLRRPRGMECGILIGSHSESLSSGLGKIRTLNIEYDNSLISNAIIECDIKVMLATQEIQHLGTLIREIKTGYKNIGWD